MRDPELVARAQRAAARLESAWERWRALQGLGETPAQPVVGYVGYALSEPWGQPRAVIGFSADEAERLAEFLERGNTDAHAVELAQRLVPEQSAEPAQRLVPEQPTVQVLAAASAPSTASVAAAASVAAVASVAKADVLAATSQLAVLQHRHSFPTGSGTRL